MTDSRPKELSIVQCLGLLKASFCSHYNTEADRRQLYLNLIGLGKMKPGYACDDNAGIYFEDNTVKRVVMSKAGAKAYSVGLLDGKPVEKVIEPELIS